MLAAKSAETNTWKRSATSKGEPSAPWLTKWPCAAAPRLCSPVNISANMIAFVQTPRCNARSGVGHTAGSSSSGMMGGGVT